MHFWVRHPVCYEIHAHIWWLEGIAKKCISSSWFCTLRTLQCKNCLERELRIVQDVRARNTPAAAAIKLFKPGVQSARGQPSLGCTLAFLQQILFHNFCWSKTTVISSFLNCLKNSKTNKILCKINDVFVAKVDFPRSIIAEHKRIRMHTLLRTASPLLAHWVIKLGKLFLTSVPKVQWIVLPTTSSRIHFLVTFFCLCFPHFSTLQTIKFLFQIDQHDSQNRTLQTTHFLLKILTNQINKKCCQMHFFQPDKNYEI